VGRKDRGRKVWKKHIEPQLVPIAPVMKRDIRRIDLARRLTDEMGASINDLYRKMLMAPKIRAKKRVIGGKAWMK
jgi:hypothetical protein